MNLRPTSDPSVFAGWASTSETIDRLAGWLPVGTSAEERRAQIRRAFWAGWPVGSILTHFSLTADDLATALWSRA